LPTWFGRFILWHRVTCWRIPKVIHAMLRKGRPLHLISAFARQGQMAGTLAALFCFLTPVFPAFGGGAVDTTTTTCKDYENGSHQDMVDIVAAFHQDLKADPNFGSLNDIELDAAIDKVCLTHMDAKVIDALKK
jgi:hypothetical protein